eukprot:6409317-Prymnesium_polylepis.1
MCVCVNLGNVRSVDLQARMHSEMGSATLKTLVTPLYNIVTASRCPGVPHRIASCSLLSLHKSHTGERS